jgi:hypothetical protein
MELSQAHYDERSMGINIESKDGVDSNKLSPGYYK